MSDDDWYAEYVRVYDRNTRMIKRTLIGAYVALWLVAIIAILDGAPEPALGIGFASIVGGLLYLLGKALDRDE